MYNDPNQPQPPYGQPPNYSNPYEQGQQPYGQPPYGQPQPPVHLKFTQTSSGWKITSYDEI